MKNLLFFLFVIIFVQNSFAQKDLLTYKELSNKKVYTKLEDAVKRKNSVYALYLLDKELSATEYNEILDMPNIQSLTLMFCKFDIAPSFIGELTNLQVLNISYCELKELPSSIGKLKNLVTLDLSGNQLTALPPELGSCTKLISINVFLNKIESLPMEMDSLDSLRVLNISKNQLYTLPNVLMKLGNLEKLDISFNPLYCLGADVLEVTEEFKKLKHCTKLRKLLIFSNNVIPQSFKNVITKYMPLGSLVLYK